MRQGQLLGEALGFADHDGRDPEQRTLLVLLPAAGEDRLGDAAAWIALDTALPPEVRGEITADAGTVQLGDMRAIAYANGTTIHLIGHVGEAGWHRAVLASDLPPALWALG